MSNDDEREYPFAQEDQDRLNREDDERYRAWEERNTQADGWLPECESGLQAMR